MSKMGKIKQIDSYISRCELVLEHYGDDRTEDHVLLLSEIVNVFSNEIRDIRGGLASYMPSPTPKERIDDIQIIKSKLINYKINLQREDEIKMHDLELARLKQPVISANASANQNQSTNVNVCQSATFSETRDKINSIDDTILSEDDKETLIGYLSTLDNLKEKGEQSKFWDKSKKVLAFLADKGADASIAILPYIISGLTNTSS